MRTISIRLDDDTDAALRGFCDRHGVTQTEAVKSAIDELARRDRLTPAELASRYGLIGGFRSGNGDLGAAHSQHLKQRLKQRRSEHMAPGPAAARRRVVRDRA